MTLQLLRWTLTIIAGSVLALSCSDGGSGTKSNSSKHSVIRSTEPPPAPPSTSQRGPIHFTDMAHHAGITFRNETGSKTKLYIPESIGQGVMLFDMDNDGDLDLYFANGGELRAEPTGRIYHNGLWRNDGNWKFTDITEGSGLECPDWSCGVSTVDFDADGLLDVYVTQLGPNRLFRNIDGKGRFEDVTATVGGGDAGWSTSSAFFDADNDGDLDLYVCNYLLFDIQNPPRGGIPCGWKDLRVSCGPRGLPEAQDTYYEFLDGRFVDRTKEAGFASSKRRKTLTAYSLGVVTSDVDHDGDIDIYVAVDSRPNLMFTNDGTGHFTEVGQSWQLAVNGNASEQAGMGVEAADMNGDGRIDMFVTNFSHDSNTLYINSGTDKNIYFTDETARVGLGGEASYPFLSWGVGIHDFDCNGLLDIFVASGHVYPQAEGIVDLGTTYLQPNQLFMGREKLLSFRDESQSAGHAMRQKRASRGTAFGDIDLDGRIDIVVLNLDDWPCLLRNECKVVCSWIGLKLWSSQAGNRSAIGARAILEMDDGSTLTREITGGGGYLGLSERFIHFGMPASRSISKINILWPGGVKQTLIAPEANHWYVVAEGNDTIQRLKD